jgi:predicted nucleic acid-binding protein
MKDSKIFIDTNILVYAKIDDGQDKHKQALDFINSNESEIIISAQVLNELYIALYKFFKNDSSTRNALTSLITDCQVAPITLQTSQAAWEIKEKYKFSYWDSLIISSALENECEFLYTEDLQDGQIINSRLTIKNPLKSKV